MLQSLDPLFAAMVAAAHHPDPTVWRRYSPFGGGLPTPLHRELDGRANGVSARALAAVAALATAPVALAHRLSRRTAALTGIAPAREPACC